MLRQRCPERRRYQVYPVGAKKHDGDQDVEGSSTVQPELSKYDTRSRHFVVCIWLVCTIGFVAVFRCFVWDWPLAIRPIPSSGIPDRLEPIATVDIKDLTFQRFYQEFREGDRPLIIKGIPLDQQPCFGGLGVFNDTLLRDCAGGEVHLAKRTEATAERKGIHVIGVTPFETFFTPFLEGALESQNGKGKYFAILNGVKQNCPNLWRHLRFPAFFTGQMLLHSRESFGDRGRIDIYFSEKGLNQTFHVDVPKGELWGSICRGKKYYRVVPRSIASRKLGWGDTGHVTLLKRPEGQPIGMPIWHGEAGPGDLVYLPAGSMHAVDNLEQTINIINDFADVGDLGPTSWTLEKIFRWKCYWSRPSSLTGCYPKILGWMTDPQRRTPVYDAVGRVTDASQTPRGFPSWDQLTQWGMVAD